MICYNYVNEYLRSFSQKDNELLSSMREYAKENKVPIVTKEVENFLLTIGEMKKPKKILEIGTAIGYSTILLSSIMKKDGRIDTVERSESMINEALKNIKLSKMEDRINLISGEAIEVLNYLDKPYDMIFLDGAKGQYKEFLVHCIRLLNKGGILITDNVLYKGMVASDDLVIRKKRTIVRNLRKFIKKLYESEYFRTSVIPLGDGVAISYKIK
jgi:predicted O-methyltransferase YrrM